MKTKSTLHTLSLAAFIFATLFCLFASMRCEAAVPEAGAPCDLPESYFAAGTWSVSPFASYRVHEFGKFNGKSGGGVALSYFAADNFAVELETLSEQFDDSHWADAFTEAGVNFKGYLPLGRSGFAPYLLVGYTRNLQIDENRMNAGAGLEWRATKRFGLFADGRWTHDFALLGHGLFRLGGNLSF